MVNEHLRLTTEEFIRRSIAVHGNDYDYSKTNYVNYLTKVTISCNVCGLEFEQKPADHYNGKGCPVCRWDKMAKTRIAGTGKRFIEKATKVHGGKYDYSKVVYTGAHSKVTIICNQCNQEFDQKATNHLSGSGCPICANRSSAKKRSIDTKELIEKARIIHGDKYDYSRVDYELSRKKVTIICKEHGEFKQSPNSHLAGRGCVKCRFKGKNYTRSEKQIEALKYAQKCAAASGKTNKLTTKQFIDKAKIIHGDRYDYGNTIYSTAKEKVEIICKKHGSFYQEASSHISGHGCPKCNYSTGEREVAKVLTLWGIEFEVQKEFPECKDVMMLRFDFFFTISNTRFLIEYQGEHHTRPIEFFEREGRVKFEWYKKHDEIKRIFAKEYGFVLIAIPHTVKDIQQFMLRRIKKQIAFNPVSTPTG